jgi:membrane protease YdiL (CAAX protease family)
MGDISKLDFSQPGAFTFIRGMQFVQFISLFLVPSFLCARLFSTDSKQYLGLRKPSHSAYFIAGIGILLLAILLTNLLGELNRNVKFPSGIENWMKQAEEEAAKTIKGLLSKNTVKDLILNVICIAGLAAVGEELLFRGMAQRLLIKMFKSPWAGIVIAAFLFSAMHMQFYGFVPRFVLGILLGAIYWYSGSLWVAILAHFLYDAVLIVLAYFNPEMLNEEAPVQLSNIALLAAVCGLLLVLLLVWMKKRSTTSYTGVYADDAIPVKDDPF